MARLDKSLFKRSKDNPGGRILDKIVRPTVVSTIRVCSTNSPVLSGKYSVILDLTLACKTT